MAQKFFELIPSGTNFQFVEKRRSFLLVSLVLVLLSIGSMVYNQVSSGTVLNFGIDFQGGSQVRLEMSEPPDLEAIRNELVELGYEGSSAVAVPDAENDVVIRVKETVSIPEETIAACEKAVTRVGDAELTDRGFHHPSENSSKIFLKYTAAPDAAEVERLLNEAGCQGTAEPGVGKQGEFPVEYTLVGVGAKLTDQLDAVFGEGAVAGIVESETVGPKVGNQLKIDGGLSMLYAIGFIFLFVMIRFDLRFAPGGIVALTHDALIVTGAFALTGREFNLQTIAALLTIIGYSINDTIVVFDRIRERVALDREADIAETTNTALNETLSRTALTSLTTLVVVAATWVLGSGPIKDFAFALFVGVIVGTYSSLFVAAPVFLFVNNRFYAGRGHLLNVEAESEGTGTLLGGAAAADEPPAGEEDDGPAEPETTIDGEKKASRRRRRKRPQNTDPS